MDDMEQRRIDAGSGIDLKWLSAIDETGQEKAGEATR